MSYHLAKPFSGAFGDRLSRFREAPPREKQPLLQPCYNLSSTVCLDTRRSFLHAHFCQNMSLIIPITTHETRRHKSLALVTEFVTANAVRLVTVV